MDARISFGILTVSDTCHSKEKEDIAGPKLEQAVQQYFPNSTIPFKKIVPDDSENIADVLRSWSRQHCNVILTTGGTGCSPRDVTPEATKAVIDKEVPGIAYAIISRSLAVTENAMLSRIVCGIKDSTLIINLPGSVKGATESFGFVVTAIHHAVALINDNTNLVKREHSKIQETIAKTEHSKVKFNCVAARKRASTYPMLEVVHAKEIILRECCPILETETILIENSLHRVMAEDVHAEDPSPPFRASIKDGYAVIASVGAGIRKVRNAIAAGDQPVESPLRPEEAVRISTGAPLPEGADAVVQVEDTELVKSSADGSEEYEINITSEPRAGQDIREIGSDIPANSKVVEQYEVISAGHIGVLATVGKSRVRVYKQPTIGIISTGNELKSHTEDLKPGQIRDSNKLTLINLLLQYNYKANDCGIARDTPNSVKDTLVNTFKDHDIIITTGGVSMGEFDLIKQVLVEDFEAIIHFGRVNMKPGKPTTFATLMYGNKRKMVFALPGNPVSACVTSLLFVIPTLRFLERRKPYEFPVVTVGAKISNDDIRPSYVRANISYNSGIFSADITGNQISSRINSLVGANCLILVPGEFKCPPIYNFKAIIIGDIVQAYHKIINKN